MNDVWREWVPPHPHWDLVLRLVPAHVFIFDAELVCRYAAPLGDEFLGQPRDQLTGRHASEILPPASNGLRPMLERAAREAAASSSPHYRYSHRILDGEAVHIWAVHVEPLAVAHDRGVLLTLADIVDLVEERDRLQLASDGLRAQLDRLRTLAEERDRELLGFEARLRTLLTPTWGYLEVLARRPDLLAGRTTASILQDLVLPQLREVIETVNNLQHLPRLGPEGL